jgi:hypothetical protein
VLSREEASSEVENGSPVFGSILSDHRMLQDPTGVISQLLDLVKTTGTSLAYVERGRAWNLARTV